MVNREKREQQYGYKPDMEQLEEMKRLASNQMRKQE